MARGSARVVRQAGRQIHGEGLQDPRRPRTRQHAPSVSAASNSPGVESRTGVGTGAGIGRAMAAGPAGGGVGGAWEVEASLRWVAIRAQDRIRRWSTVGGGGGVYRECVCVRELCIRQGASFLSSSFARGRIRTGRRRGRGQGEGRGERGNNRHSSRHRRRLQGRVSRQHSPVFV